MVRILWIFHLVQLQLCFFSSPEWLLNRKWVICGKDCAANSLKVICSCLWGHNSFGIHIGGYLSTVRVCVWGGGVGSPHDLTCLTWPHRTPSLALPASTPQLLSALKSSSVFCVLTASVWNCYNGFSLRFRMGMCAFISVCTPLVLSFTRSAFPSANGPWRLGDCMMLWFDPVSGGADVMLL